jgi:ATP-dependent Lon protease
MKAERPEAEGAQGLRRRRSEIVRYYTREAGVRNLEREMSKICRKAVKELLLEGVASPSASRRRTWTSILGVHRFRYGAPRRTTRSAR